MAVYRVSREEMSERITDISKKFRKFLDIDIEGLCEEEHTELLRCCASLLIIADEVEQNL